jgi:uncharacterized integral membrane protein (TIGR00698 family)
LTVVFNRLRDLLTAYLPGTMVCGVIALAATFLSEHYGGPQLLHALLIGLAFHFLMSNPQIKTGVDFCGRTVLRCGVALLGARITFDQVRQLGLFTAAVVVVALALTIGLGILLARWLGRTPAEGLLTGGAVAICGASAALAISSVLPQTRDNERFTLLVVVGVTVLSTLAMVIYPFSVQLLGLAPQAAGIFLGGTIHDVAQVVAAGMMLGPQAGDTATLVKLFRVMLLMPVVVVIVIAYRNHPSVKVSNQQVPLIPGFLIAFIVLVLLATVGIIQAPAARLAGDVSRGLLVTAIAAAGIKTSFEDLVKLGWQPVIMLVGETVFIATFVLVAVIALKLGT